MWLIRAELGQLPEGSPSPLRYPQPTRQPAGVLMGQQAAGVVSGRAWPLATRDRNNHPGRSSISGLTVGVCRGNRHGQGLSWVGTEVPGSLFCVCAQQEGAEYRGSLTLTRTAHVGANVAITFLMRN